MDINELIAAVTEGLDPAQVATVRAAIERDAVKNKAAAWKTQTEYQDLQTRVNAMNLELEGDAATKKLGTREYQKWYNDNIGAINKLQADIAAYEAKHGKLDGTPPPNPNPPAKAPTPEEIDAMVDKRIREGYSPKWSEAVTVTAKILQKHMLAGRKTAIDMDELAKTANTNHKGDLEAAYDAWDKPQRDIEAKAAEDKRVEQRVQDELQKRNAPSHFPSFDNTPGSLAMKTKDQVDKFDKVALAKELANTWMSAADGGTKQ